MASNLIAVSGNTYPVKEQLKALGARWNAEAKAWMVEPSQAERARAIVAGQSGSSSTSNSTTSRPGQASEKQCAAIRKLLRRVEHVRMFDSFSGTGPQLVDQVEDQIRQWGGMSKLTSKQASQIIDQLIGAVEDEM